METETTDLVSSDMLQQIPAPAKKHPKRTNSSVSSFVRNTTHMDMTFFGLLNLCHWTTHEPRSWKGLICRAARECTVEATKQTRETSRPNEK